MPLTSLEPGPALLAYLKKYWFLLSLVALLVLGSLGCRLLEPLTRFEWAKWIIVTTTMFLMAWPLETGQLRRSLIRPWSALLASTLNVGLIPLLIWPFAWMTGPELAGGLLVAGATPCTLASAAVWTRRAGGDDSIAILVTILTNATCFLILPFWIYVQTGNELEPGKLIGTIYKLLGFVVLPIALGQLVRLHRPSARWATHHKSQLGVWAMLGVLSIVFLGAIQMGLRLQASTGTLSALGLSGTALLVSFVHVLVFWVGIDLARRLGFSREEQIAVGFSGSQKTLMIGLSTSISLGFNMIPIIMFHTVQLVVDTVFAERIREATPTTDRS